MSKWKNYFGEWYQAHESFILRTPLFPIEVFFDWTTEGKNDMEHTKESLLASLRQFYLQPIAQEALLIGSPDLYQQLKLWLENKIENAEKKEKTELALLKYMIRSCTRCTPYGLFATCTSGTVSNKTGIHLDGLNAVERHGRLDMDYVCQVHTHLLRQKEIRDQLLFYPNTSLYLLGDQLRYIEYRFREDAGRSYHLVQIEQSEYVDRIISKAREGCSPAMLAHTIIDHEITDEEALEFIYELIESQVIVSELEPNVTGEDYFTLMLRKLKSLQHTEKYVLQFEKVVQEFNELSSEENHDKTEIYHRIAGHLEPLGIPLHLKTLIQVDAYRKSSDCTLNRKIGDELLSAASLLHLLSSVSPVRDSFSDFKNAFRNRYDDQWVPLVDVLDTESGIGYGKFATSGMEESPLIDHLPIGNGQATVYSTQIADAEAFKWQLYQQAIDQHKTEVLIDPKTIEQLSAKEFNPTHMPDSIFIMMKVYAPSAADIAQGNYRIAVQSPSGPSGANLLGRFCHLNPDIEELVKTVLRNEEAHHPESIFAEIVHLPESRIGNILMRPVLRGYEIPYLCGTQLSREFQIPVTDLLVGIENDKVLLRSNRLGKRVIPRMTTAHNFSMTTLPVYQFLCDLQYQQVGHVGWQWGILENRPFLPRISYGKYILSRARWLLTKDDIKDCLQKKDADIISSFVELAEKKNLPEYILLTQGDNELMLHLRNILCIRLLLQEVQKIGAVVLTESNDVPGQCWIKSSDGHHAGEFVLTFSKKIKTPFTTQKEVPVRQLVKQPERIFPVGSEWLFAKIYCGTKTAERLLCEVLKPFTEELLAAKTIEKYFFLRYHDSGNHLRIRFYNDRQPGFWIDVIQRLQELLRPFMVNKTISNLSFETYQRELERYGCDTMEASEDIFYHQSVSILNFLSMLSGDEGEQYRWKVAFKAIDLFLYQFGYSLEQKRDLIKELQKLFSLEFKIEPPAQRKIAERFYNNKILIRQLMNEEELEDENAWKGIHVFRNITTNYRSAIEQVLAAPSIHNDMNSLNKLMPSYLHMLVNRMFVSNQRKIELVLYSHLLKYYESQIAMAKNKVVEKVKEEFKA
ncbi:MAG TPA: lantibiotic dehydratase [Saprospiraceae bacterium]|nr:lantibiotic dehydratase [Saprospiraceae bacterium]